MEKKKAEVRARLEAQSASKKKKGFMTPERKKKLRVIELSHISDHALNATHVQCLLFRNFKSPTQPH